MSADTETIDRFVAQEYKWGFYTDIEADTLPPGRDEDVVRHISTKKNEPFRCVQRQLSRRIFRCPFYFSDFLRSEIGK